MQQSSQTTDAPRALQLFRAAGTLHFVLLAGLGLFALVLPGLILVRELARPDLYGPAIPSLAWRLHRSLTPRLVPRSPQSGSDLETRIRLFHRIPECLPVVSYDRTVLRQKWSIRQFRLCHNDPVKRIPSPCLIE